MTDAAVTQATFCATLVDEWARAGVRLAFVSPGSRSTPLALALAADERIAVHVHHDERCTAFLALGAGLAAGDAPAVALCTSGTAATHFHAAVVEAHHARVPLLVVTADRPPELRDVGAPQTIDQSHLYGGAVRWFLDPGPADEAMRSSWRSIAARSVVESADGPVHLNLPFREPLVADPGELPPGRDDGAAWTTAAAPARLAPVAVQGRALFLAGGGAPLDDRTAMLPVLASPLARTSRAAAPVVAHADALLRVPDLVLDLRPDLVVQSGTVASRVINEWVAGSGARHVVLGDRWLDPGRTVGELAGTFGAIEPPPPGWLDRWLALDAAADAAIASVLADHPEPTEPGTARTLLAALPAGAHLVVSSSMPVRDLEWYARPRADVTVHANRGANGIDGVLSTAAGVALAAAAPTACLLGDIAFLHDSNALIGLADRGVDLTIVVVDNDGGGIFSFLPQATSLASECFEQLFGTPHGVRPEHLAAAHGLTSLTVESADALPSAIAASVATGGIRLVVVRTDRAANVKLHDELHAAVADAVTRLS